MNVARRALHSLARFVGRVVGLAMGVSVGAVAIGGCLALLLGTLPRMGRSAVFKPPALGNFSTLNERSIVLDRNGHQIAVFKSAENRKTVPLARVPKQLIQTILDVEDADFYRHKGFNLRSTSRAMLSNLAAGGIEQGGSTITQQLIKTDLLTRTQQFDRKIREARLAVELERTKSKSWILDRYVNTVYFGGGAYGVEAAANHYFGISVERLDIGQSAFLAGMIRNPVGYDPVRFRERSRERRSIVLNRLVAQKHLSVAEAKMWAATSMPTPVASPEDTPNSYFVEAVKQELLIDPRLGATAQERYESVFNGGLRVTTTYDPDLQADAEKAVSDILPQQDVPTFTAALVSMDVDSGAVRALVGGRGFATDKYNLATQAKRQPGSSWKPFTLIAAMEEGNSPRSIISGIEPCPIPNPEGKPDPYLPNNSSEGSGSVSSLPDQRVFSSNCAYARLATVVGLDKVVNVAKRLGITTKLDAVPAMALGTEEVHPIEMAAAYATIANDGVFHRGYLISKVERVRGRAVTLLFNGTSKGRQAISRQVARMATKSMQEVVRRGTGTKAQLGKRAVAGKTGTTQNYEDAWFVGFTAQTATAVWMGAPAGKVPMTNVGGIRVTGGSYPARIWQAYMDVATTNDPLVDFAEPDPHELGKSGCLQLKKPTINSPNDNSGGRGYSVGALISAQTDTTSPRTRKQSTKSSKRRRSGGGGGGNCDSWGSTSAPRKVITGTRKRRPTATVDPATDGSAGDSPVPVIGNPVETVPPPEATPAPAPAPVPVPDPVPAAPTP